MKNPKWHRDEVVLALDLYFDKNLGSISTKNPKIIALSEFLNRLKIHNNKKDLQKFRNPNGIVMKLANFKALDPNYKGEGLKAYSKLEKELFEEFYLNVELLHKTADKIRQVENKSETKDKTLITVKN